MKLPDYNDPDTEDKVTISLSLGKASSFISGSYPHFTISPSASENNGTFIISVRLQDDNPNP
jgi:hypothetical protein